MLLCGYCSVYVWSNFGYLVFPILPKLPPCIYADTAIVYTSLQEYLVCSVGNTRVITQSSLQTFQEEMGRVINDPYKVGHPAGWYCIMLPIGGDETKRSAYFSSQ